MTTYNRFWFCLLLGGLLIASGCSKHTITIIPEQDTAELQFAYAWQRRAADIPPIEAKSRRLFFEKQIDYFEKVIKRFPEDTTYTPEAVLSIAEILFRMNRYSEMIDYLQQARLLYPHHPDFEPRALYLIGRAYDENSEFVAANATYKECITKYENSPNETIQLIVRESRRYYNRPKTKTVPATRAAAGG